jgi:hypothetical protein
MFQSSTPVHGIALLILVSSPAFASDAVKVVYPSEDRKVAAALESPANETYFGAMREVLAGIAKDKHIPIIVDEASLQRVPEAMADVVDYDVNDLDPQRAELDGLDVEHGPRLAAVLDVMFERYAIAYVVEDGALKIMTAADAARKKLLRAYDVSAMLDSTMSAESLAKTVSNIASGLEPSRLPRLSRGGLDKQYFDQPQPVHVSAFRQTLVCFGSKYDQERVARAIAFLRELNSE